MYVQHCTGFINAGNPAKSVMFILQVWFQNKRALARRWRLERKIDSVQLHSTASTIEKKESMNKAITPESNRTAQIPSLRIDYVRSLDSTLSLLLSQVQSSPSVSMSSASAVVSSIPALISSKPPAQISTRPLVRVSSLPRPPTPIPSLRLAHMKIFPPAKLCPPPPLIPYPRIADVSYSDTTVFSHDPKF